VTSAGPRRVIARATSILPRGSGVVGGWVLFTGVASYSFLTITGRALGPERYGGLSTLWALGFLLGNGACLPIEQEVSRALASRAARGVGGAPLIRRATIGTLALAGVLVTGCLLAGPWLVKDVFDDEALLLVGLILLLAGYTIEYLVRGVLAGNSRFSPYGILLGGERKPVARHRRPRRSALPLRVLRHRWASRQTSGAVALRRRDGSSLPDRRVALSQPRVPWLLRLAFAQALINRTDPRPGLAPAKDETATGQFLASL
jgi:hypothetical protein